MRLEVDEASQYAGANDLADQPTQVDVTGQVGSQSNWHDLGRICRAQGLEDAPGETAEDFRGHEQANVEGEEGQEDEHAQCHERAHQSV